MGRYVKQYQSNFSSGELTETLKGRVDIKGYYNGGDRMRNVVIRPQGGAKRRPGMRRVAEVSTYALTKLALTLTAPNGGTAANGADNNDGTFITTTTNMGTISPYVVCHCDLGSAQAIKYADVRVLHATAAIPANEYRIQYSTDNVTWSDLGLPIGSPVSTVLLVTRRRSTLQQTPQTARYWRLARIGTADLGTAKTSVAEFQLWVEDTAAGQNAAHRCMSFEFNATDQTYLMVASDQNIDVYKGGAWQAAIPVPHRGDKATTNQLYTMNWTQSLDTMLLFHKDVAPFQITRQGADSEWDAVPITFTNIPTYNYGSGAEAIFSVTRGYPQCGTFHEGRLYMGGLKSRPATVIASVSGSFFDLDQSTSAADKGFDFTFDTDAQQEVFNIYSGRHLSCFTSGGEFYILPNIDPITPESVIAKRTTDVGSHGPGTRVVGNEGGLLFLQQYATSLREFLFTDTEAAYTSENISLLAPHLLDQSTTRLGNTSDYLADVALRRSSTADEGDQVAVVMNGVINLLQTLRTQGITAWSRHSTQGIVECVGVDQGDFYFVTRRTMGSLTKDMLEVWDERCMFDGGVYLRVNSPGTITQITGLSYAEGDTLKVRVNGYNMSDEVVSGGIIVPDQIDGRNAEAGLNFPDVSGDGSGWLCLVRDMPVELQPPEGWTVGRRMRIPRIDVRVHQSQYLSMRANGGAVQEVDLGLTHTYQGGSFAGESATGVFRLDGTLGYTDEAQVELGQQTPGPLFLLGCNKVVSV
jgi:hypothetical protein